MKAAKAIVGLGLGLGFLAMVAVEAEAQQCHARITKQSFSASETVERAWDIQFQVNVDGCAASSGTFEYVVRFEVEGRTELATASASFETETAGPNTITIEYAGPFGSNLKDVRSVKVKTCECS